MSAERRVTRIVGGTVWTSRGAIHGDVVIDDDGRIAQIVETPGDPLVAPSGNPVSSENTTPWDGDVIDAQGLWVFPGVIDVHVHFREPGLTDKEDFLSGSKSALAGGVTTVLDMPNTLPPITDGPTMASKYDAIEGRSWVHYGLFGALTPKGSGTLIDRVQQMVDAGACGAKIFMGPTTGALEAPNWGQLYAVARHFAQSDVVFVFHAEDRDTIRVATDEVTAQIKRGERSAADYDTLLRSRPRFGELIATDAALKLALTTGARVHIAHVTLKEAVDAIARAKSDGARVSAETGPQYLFLTDEDYDAVGPMMKVLPPVRCRADQHALWDGLRDGVIDAVATDHAPHDKPVYDPKGPKEDALEGPFGAAGVQTLLPLMLNAVNGGRLTATRALDALCGAPARIFPQLGSKGQIAPGHDADVTLIDPRAPWTISRHNWHGKSANSPFFGVSGEGAPVAVIVGGYLKWARDVFVGHPSGRALPSPH